MKSYFGSFQPASGMEPVEASVLVFDSNMSIGYRSGEGLNSTLNWRLKDVSATFEVSREQTRIRHQPSGRELLIPGKDAAAFIHEMQEELQKSWHRKKGFRYKLRSLFLLLIVAAILLLLYLLFVPWMSEKMAGTVSTETERQLGDAVYDGMGLAALEDKEASYKLNQFFAAMEVESGYRIRISVVKDEVVNAFALPGGRIVVYTALLKQVQSYPELAALLSHEFTHVNNRHATRSIFRRLGSKVFISLLFGRFGSVAAVLADHADDLKSLTYSRKLEKEADLEGLGILLHRKIDPAGYEDLFRHLKNSAGDSILPEFLGSHPDIDKRTAYIKELSKQAKVEPREDLKAIFEQLMPG
ncbi:MAG: M48 family metallopeptidase [Sphingobacteriales bacterium]|nr:M48 family metallopeptidase [Sphingobacteriales bacterium]